MNDDTDKSTLPEYALGHVLRDVIWRILFLYDRVIKDVEVPPRILLANRILRVLSAKSLSNAASHPRSLTCGGML